MPTSLPRLPSSSAPSTSSRRNSTFPCDPITRRWTVAPVDRPAEDGEEQLLHGAGVEAAQFQALDGVVLPQRHDRVGGRFAAAQRGDDQGGAGHGHLVDERGREVVEEMSVVDRKDEGPAGGRFDNVAGAAAEQVGPVVDAGFRP